MKTLASLILLGLGLFLFQGCASGPGYAEVKGTIPPLNPEKARVYLYRTSVLGAALSPAINLDGASVGTSRAQGFLYVDTTPGSHTVETATEVTRKLSFTLEKGQTRYVKFGVTMGFFVGHVYPELVDNAVGESEIVSCKFTGTQ
jgi:hypothetical protein